eukprot:SAG31_NODE_40378_length_281_cov_0.747253_1_plen_38_part_10
MNYYGQGWNIQMMNALAGRRRVMLAAAAAGRGGWHEQV